MQRVAGLVCSPEFRVSRRAKSAIRFFPKPNDIQDSGRRQDFANFSGIERDRVFRVRRIYDSRN